VSLTPETVVDKINPFALAHIARPEILQRQARTDWVRFPVGINKIVQAGACITICVNSIGGGDRGKRTRLSFVYQVWPSVRGMVTDEHVESMRSGIETPEGLLLIPALIMTT
jgi:hypothetical protein